MDPVPEAEAHSGHQKWLTTSSGQTCPTDNYNNCSTLYTGNENQCISLAGLSSSERRYTVLTCEQPFDVTVSMGQRLHIEKSDGSSHNMLPSATYGSTGVYQYDDGVATGTIRIENPQWSGIQFESSGSCCHSQNVNATFSGGSHTITGVFVGLHGANDGIKNLKIYTHMTDSNGNYITSRHDDFNQVIPRNGYGDYVPPGVTPNTHSSTPFVFTGCCLPDSNNPPASVALYLIQSYYVTSGTGQSFGSDGKQLFPTHVYAEDDKVYWVTAVSPDLTITSLQTYPCDAAGSSGTGNNCGPGPLGHMRYNVEGTATNLSPSQPLTSIITDSNGNVVHQHPSAQTTASPGTTFGMEAPVFYQSGQFGTESNGTFTLTVCAPEFNVCDSENFTITSVLSGDTSLIITVPPNFTAYATNSTGQSYHHYYHNMVNNPLYSGINYEVVICDGSSSNHLGFMGGNWAVCDSNGNRISYWEAAGGGNWILSASCSPAPDTLLPIGTNTITCTATDTAGNTGTASFNVNVILQESSDTTPPVVLVPSNLVFTGTASGLYINPSVIESQLQMGFNDIPNNPPTATDNVGVVFGPACTPDAANSVPGYDYAWGNNGNPLGALPYPLGITTITCTATDAAGNVGTASFTVTVNAPGDTTLPVITFTASPQNGSGSSGTTSTLTVQATNSTGQNAYFGVLENGISVHDNSFNINTTCSASPVPTYTAAWGGDDPGSWWKSGATFPIGNTTVTCTGTDADGNVGTASLTVTVIGPTIVELALGSITPGCEETDSCNIPYSAVVPVGGTVIWKNIDNAAHTTTSGTQITGPSGHFNSELIFAGGSYSHTFDEEGTWYYFDMVAPWRIGKVVVGDGTPIQTDVPATQHLTITVPPDFTAYATNSTGQSYHPWYHAMINNPLYSGINLPVNFCDGSSDSWFMFYGLPVCDSDGDLIPSNQLVGGYASCSPTYHTLLPIGTNTITCAATDNDGNTGTASFTVTVVLEESSDTTLPVITFTTCVDCMTYDPTPLEIVSGGSHTVQATNSTGQNAYFTVLENGEDARNNNFNINTTCSASPEPTYTISGILSQLPSHWWHYGATFPIGNTTVTCTGTDADGNVGTASLTVTVNAPADTTPPGVSGTFEISENGNHVRGWRAGGDCVDIGIWNSGSNTCTLTSNVTGQIIIADNGITLDGNGHTFTGTQGTFWFQGGDLDINGSGDNNEFQYSGSLFVIQSVEVTVKNIQFTKSYSGYGFQILGVGHCGNCEPTVISGNTFATTGGASGGLYIGPNKDVHNCQSSFPPYNCQVMEKWPTNVQVTSNTFLVPNSALGVDASPFYWGVPSSISITGNTFSGGGSSEIFQLKADIPVTVSGNTFNNISNERGLAIYPKQSTGSEQAGEHIITGNTFSGLSNNAGVGLIFFNSGSNVVSGNTFSNLANAIDFGTCCGGSLTDSNVISANTFSGNNYDYYPSEPTTTTEPFDTSLTITVPLDFTAYATNSTGQSYHHYYHNMVNSQFYSGINSSVNLCDGSSQSWMSFNSIPVCNSIGNLVGNSSLAARGCSPDANTLLPIGVNTITCTATDNDGNTGTASFTVTVVLEGAADTTLPVITFTTCVDCMTYDPTPLEIVSGGSHTVHATNSTGQNAYFTVLENGEDARNNNFNINTTCSASPVPTYTISGPLSQLPTDWWHYGATFPIGNTTVTCTGTDADGNVGTASLTVTVNAPADTTLPVITFTALPQNGSGSSGTTSTLTVQATNSTGQNAYFAVLENGEDPWNNNFNINTTCSASPVPTYTHDGYALRDDPGSWWKSGATFPIGNTTVTCTGTDADGNVGTASLAVNVNPSFDTTLTITVPPDFTAYATNSTGQSYSMYWAYMATDPLYSGIVEFTKCDGSNVGLSSHGDWKFYAIPVCDSSGNLINTSSIASSGCSPAYETLLPIGTNTITCAATDTAGNVGIGSFTITVIGPEAEEAETSIDITLPVIAESPNVFIQTTDPTGRDVIFPFPSASDNVAIDTVSCSPASGTFFPTGTTNVICTATDTAGNVAYDVFVVGITYALYDTDQPVFPQISSVTVDTTETTGAIYNYAIPTPFDNVGVTVGPTCDPAPGNLLPVGTTTVTCTASDAVGNTGSVSFNVTVINTEATGNTNAPTFESQDDIFQETDIANGSPVYYITPTATDDEEVTEGPTCTPVSGYFFPIGDTVVTCIAKDEAGNQGTVSFTVSVEYTGQTSQNVSVDATGTPEIVIQDVLISGDTENSVSAGGLAKFTTSISSNSTSSALVAITVMDSDNISLGVGYFKSILGLDNELQLGFKIPNDAISGVANVYVNVYTDWIDAGGISITDEVEVTVDIIGIDPTDLGAFNYYVDPIDTDIYKTAPGFDAQNIVNGAISYWQGSPPIETFNLWSDVLEYSVNSYANSKVPFGDDFVTDLTFSQVPYDLANLQMFWVKEYGSAVGIAPISGWPEDVTVQNIFMGLGDSDCGDVWQPYSKKYLTETLQHEMGHVIGFAHDDDSNSLMYPTSSDVYPIEYGIVEDSFTTTEGYAQFIPVCTSRDQTNFNYHVSVDSGDIGVDVKFVRSGDALDSWADGESFEVYAGCSDDDMLSITNTCNNVEQGSGLLIIMPEQSTGILTDVTVKMQENFDGTQTLSDVSASQVAPIISSDVAKTKFELLEQDIEVDLDIALLDGEEFLTIEDTALTQDNDKFTIVGWIRPDFSEGSQESTIVSKQDSFKVFLTKSSFQQQGGHTIMIPNHTMNLSLYDGVKWFTLYGNTEIMEDWYYVAVVVDGSNATLYLDGVVDVELKLQKKMVSGLCSEKECFIDTKMSVSDKSIVIGAYSEVRMLPNQQGILVPDYRTFNHLAGLISSIEVYSDAFTDRQISKLYAESKNYYKKDVALNPASITTKSPALSDSECLDLALKSGLQGKLTETITLVCQFPFDVVISLNSDVLWIETLPADAGPYHSISSVDGLFRTGPISSASMSFYEPDFTYGTYEYFDEFNKSLTGKIIITKPLERFQNYISTMPEKFYSMVPIEIARHSAGPDCEINNSCYQPFAVSVDIGEEVIWKNLDRFSHSVTSGAPEDGPDGVFDSGLIGAIRTFSHTFDETGIYDYYCTYHPWMKGIVVVGEV